MAGGTAGEFQDLALEDVAEKFGGSFMVAVSATVGLGNNFVDDAEFAKIRGHDFHGDGSCFRLGGVAPDDGSATLGRNHGVETVFQNVDAIADSDC